MLNKIFHQAIRTEIMATIIANEETSFSMLKEALQATFGNIFVHLNKLENAKYIESKKIKKNKKSYTSYKVTTLGLEEFYIYVREVELIIEKIKK